MLTPISSRRALLNRRGDWLTYATAGYNLAEGVMAAVAGAVASSTALVVVVTWRFRARPPESRERLALKLIAVSFFTLSGWVGFSALRALFGNGRAESSPVGIGLVAVSLVVMALLVWATRRTGRELGSATVMADSTQTLLCTYLSAILLVGLVVNATLGWSWADPIAALVIAAVAVREGVQAWRGEGCGCGTADTAGVACADECCVDNVDA
jgi:Co/Zn/Cd efflux system component